MTTSRALRRASAATAAAALGLAGAAFAVQPAAAATFTVTSLDDSGVNTLRWAIDQANASEGPDTITFGVTGEIILASEVAVVDPVTIVGPGVDALTITRDAAFDMLVVNSLAEGNFAVSNLSFVGEDAEGDSGRAINASVVNGTVEVISVGFSGLSSSEGGGAVNIDNALEVTVTDVVATDNHSGDTGGAFQFGSIEGDVTLSSSYFSGNTTVDYGGAVRFAEVEGAVAVTDSVFEDNSAEFEGGGIQFENVLGPVVVDGSSFVGNSARNGGGLYFYDIETDPAAGEVVTVSNSTFTANTAHSGAGLGFNVWVENLSGQAVVVDSSTFFGNQAAPEEEDDDPRGLSIAASLYSPVTATVVNSTFDETSELAQGPAAIVLGGSVEGALLEVFHSTVIGPPSILLLAEVDGEEVRVGAVNVSHTILQSTTDDQALDVGFIVEEGEGGGEGLEADAAHAPVPEIADAAPAANGPLLSDGYTLEWSVVSTGVDDTFVAQGAGNQLETDPQLAPLADNGGATLTRLPADTSPAVNTGDPAVEGAPAVDQRGAARVVETIDVGAVELPAPAPSLAATGGTVDWTLLLGAAGVLLLGAAGLVIARTRKA